MRDEKAEMMKVIHFESAPEHVKKLAFSIMETLCPSIADLSPKAALICGKGVGLRAATYIDAVRWVVEYFESRVDIGPIENRESARSVAKRFEDFAAALEAEVRANPKAHPPVLTIDGREYF
jgi:hypothetical protein